MFDNIGYKLLDKGLVRNFPTTCFLELKESLCVFGHMHGVITLWDTSKRVLGGDELVKLQQSIVDATIAGVDTEMLAKHNMHIS